MGVFGWKELQDDVELKGVVRRFTLAGDGDWILEVAPSEGFESFLKNPQAPGPNVKGVLECEVEPPDTLRSQHGDLPAEEAGVCMAFFEPLCDKEVIVRGTWSIDKSHRWNDTGDEQHLGGAGDGPGDDAGREANGWTEIHPMTSVLYEERVSPRLTRADLFVFADASSNRPGRVPHTGENRTGRFRIPFPSSGQSGSRPGWRVLDEHDMSASRHFEVVQDGGQHFLQGVVESGRPQQRRGFYFAQLELWTS